MIAGLGHVGQRKLEGLLACDPAGVLALDIAPPTPEAVKLLEDPRVHFACRPLSSSDLRHCVLAFAATNDAAENARIIALCAEHGVLCCSVTSPQEANFHVPAVARCDTLAAAISTSGASPALARRWKSELQDWLAPRSRMAKLMGRIRPLVLALNHTTEYNTHLFRTLATSPLQDRLAKADWNACELLLRKILPPDLHDNLAELLHDLP